MNGNIKASSSSTIAANTPVVADITFAPRPRKTRDSSQIIIDKHRAITSPNFHSDLIFSTSRSFRLPLDGGILSPKGRLEP